jgi:hypothetical protein
MHLLFRLGFCVVSMLSFSNASAQAKPHEMIKALDIDYWMLRYC